MRDETRATAIEEFGNSPGKSTTKTIKEIQYLDVLSTEEERLLLKHYEKTIIGVCLRQKFSRHVQTTALMYLKRFYLHRSVLGNDPSRYFLACIYVAAKVEEEYPSMDQLIAILPNMTENILKKTEFKLLDGLQYDLIVHAPFKDIDGWIEVIHLAQNRLMERNRTFPSIYKEKKGWGQ